MRKELKKMNKIRTKFRMEFVRYGKRTNWNGYEEVTYLFKNITNLNGKVVADHIWLKDGKRIRSLGPLTEGDIVEFEGRVDEYIKGYVCREYDEREVDYTIKYPNNFILLSSSNNNCLDGNKKKGRTISPAFHKEYQPGGEA